MIGRSEPPQEEDAADEEEGDHNPRKTIPHALTPESSVRERAPLGATLSTVRLEDNLALDPATDKTSSIEPHLGAKRAGSGPGWEPLPPEMKNWA